MKDSIEGLIGFICRLCYFRPVSRFLLVKYKYALPVLECQYIDGWHLAIVINLGKVGLVLLSKAVLSFMPISLLVYVRFVFI